MPEYLQVFRARVPQESVVTLVQIRPVAIAEAQRLCPALLGAELVRLDDDNWLHVLRWSHADGEQRLMRRGPEFGAITKMHDLLGDAAERVRGEIVNTSGRCPGAATLRRWTSWLVAADGDREALSALVREIQQPMYRLAAAVPRPPRRCAGRLSGDPHSDRDPARHVRGPVPVHDLGLLGRRFAACCGPASGSSRRR